MLALGVAVGVFVDEEGGRGAGARGHAKPAAIVALARGLPPNHQGRRSEVRLQAHLSEAVVEALNLQAREERAIAHLTGTACEGSLARLRGHVAHSLRLRNVPHLRGLSHFQGHADVGRCQRGDRHSEPRRGVVRRHGPRLVVGRLHLGHEGGRRAEGRGERHGLPGRCGRAHADRALLKLRGVHPARLEAAPVRQSVDPGLGRQVRHRQRRVIAALAHRYRHQSLKASPGDLPQPHVRRLALPESQRHHYRRLLESVLEGEALPATHA
mmetsp:Transcript_118043/g.280219  ORF Transcript_118043/g.280219 Transcript_118043/m.280219 type:complete len:269 (+) Transcript_118043:1329-2135(+)